MQTFPHKKWNPFVQLDLHDGIFLQPPPVIPIAGSVSVPSRSNNTASNTGTQATAALGGGRRNCTIPRLLSSDPSTAARFIVVSASKASW